MKKLILALTFLFLAIPCQARIITVDDDEAADFNNIQAAIDDSNDGDIIEVQPGRYTENINFLGKDITLTSTNPTDEVIVDSTIIDGNDVNSVVIFSGTESSDCVLRGFTITNGEAPEGGGIYGNGTLSTIENNIIIGNNAVGYGIPGSYGWGGGLLDCDGLIQNNIITGNYGGWGGGLLCCDGSIKDNIISYNGWYAGGGMSCCGGEISNNLLVGNRAVYGGALSCCNGIIRNCTVVGNWANGSGLDACNGSISNCIIWKNGGGIWTQIKDCSTPIYSCIEDWTGAGTGNTSADPCFANMGYWQQQGSFLRWVENGADYHLRSQAGRWEPSTKMWVQDDVTSPCIDAGNPGCPLSDEPNDPNNVRINMGAYGGTAEASKSPANWRSIADMTNNWVVDSKDLKVFVGYWLETGECIPSDLDRSQSVDFNDFAIFGLQWSQPSASEPSMTFQIDDCNMEEGQSRPVAAESNEPRFSLWVEGRYIHFEDLMYANCCPEELGLDKEINGNQITLYEIGYGGMCFCMCYFPITATLGPFEDGTYTVEVYDNYGNSLGVVEVTIGGSTGPDITYQIEDCNRDASDVFAAEPPDKTRFTVTVEGLYVHFKDMMTANCCPDELGLEMMVDDDLITIYETEYTLEGCRCMCSFPITARLGPFEPGAYILEVYEYHGGFIGSTTVVIDPPE